MPRSNLLIFIPTLNEAGNIENVLNDVSLNFSDFDLLIIDDGSTDGTLQIIDSGEYSNLTVIKNQSRLGIGKAHIDSINYAKQHTYRFLLTLDGDGTHSGKDLKELFLSLQSSGVDVVIGSRFIDSKSIRDWPLRRVLLTKMGHLATKFGLGLKFDCSSGCRGYCFESQNFIEVTNLKSFSYDFFFKSTFVMSKNKYSLLEVPITLSKRASGNSKMKFRIAVISILKLFVQIISFRLFFK
jgi:dolichol-phosphate mannosyltransferase